MFWFRRSLAEGGSRVQALRELFRKCLAENNCEARGLRLLRDWLSPEQRAQFDAARYFDVVGCDSGNRYRIYYGTAANVHEIDDAGRSKVGWCVAPIGQLTAGDVMLAQKIALETTEFGTLAVANIFSVALLGPRNRS
jgi:hypothetical protein